MTLYSGKAARRILGLATALGGLFAAPAASAFATPQALGLVATLGPVPMQCNGTACVAFLSSFCLEEERRAPVARRAYAPAPGSRITLVVETGDGRTVQLPAAEHLSFNVRLDFTSILAQVPQESLAELSPARVSIQVGPMATLLPVPMPGDTNAHSDDEIKLVTGPYRKTGTRFFDEGGEVGETVSMMTQMINRMPRKERMDRTARAGDMQVVMQGPDAQAASSGARTRFKAIVAGCENLLSTTKRMNMRGCLTYRHEVMQTKTNRAFWKALGGV